jgi:hypothetical protein
MMEYVGVSDRLKSNGWTVAQESRLVNGNTLILDIVAIRDQRTLFPCCREVGVFSLTIVGSMITALWSRIATMSSMSVFPSTSLDSCATVQPLDFSGDDEVEFYGLAIGALKTPSASLLSDSTT